MSSYIDSGTVRSKTTPVRTADGITHTETGTIRSASKIVATAEGKQWAETATIRSKATVVGADHYCTFIPTFEFNADMRFQVSDDFKRFNVNGANRYTWYVELNPQANPC